MKPLISPLKSIIRTVLSQNIISALIMSSSLVVGSSDSSSSTPTNSIYNIKLRPVAKHQSITADFTPSTQPTTSTEENYSLIVEKSSATLTPISKDDLNTGDSNDSVASRRLSYEKAAKSGENSLTAYMREKEKSPQPVGIPLGSISLKRASFKAAPTVDNPNPNLTTESSQIDSTAPTVSVSTLSIETSSLSSTPLKAITTPTSTTKMASKEFRSEDFLGMKSLDCASADSMKAIYSPNSTDSISSLTPGNDSRLSACIAKVTPYNTPPTGGTQAKISVRELANLRSVRVKDSIVVPVEKDSSPNLNQLSAVEPIESSAVAAPIIVVAYLSPGFITYSFEELKTGATLPLDVDPSQRELYLENEYFKQLFGMDKESFSALRKWKRDSLKKTNGIF